jgi:hypothetical protein
MPEFRCPKHDLVFETLTDHRKPDAPATDNFAAHPVHGHPDCPQCILEAEDQPVTSVGDTGIKTLGKKRVRIIA